MTQISRIQPGHRYNDGYLDSGPYNADEWAELFNTMLAYDPTSEGPFWDKLNELEVSVNGSNIEVETGYGLCYGRWFKNDALTIFTPTRPTVNPRIDIVCMVLNYRFVPLTTGIATPNTLIFPTVLTDYEGLSSVPAYRVRLVILPGNEAAVPVAPTLDTNPDNVAMAPLFQYQISTGAVFSNQTDLRDFVHSNFYIQPRQIENRTRRTLIVPVRKRNITDSTSDPGSGADSQVDGGYPLLTAKQTLAYGEWVVPDDFVSGLTLTPILLAFGAAQVYCSHGVNYAQIGEVFGTHSGSVAGHIINLVANTLYADTSVSLSSASIGDIVKPNFQRVGTNVNDTYASELFFIGWLAEYTADS